MYSVVDGDVESGNTESYVYAPLICIQASKIGSSVDIDGACQSPDWSCVDPAATMARLILRARVSPSVVGGSATRFWP